MNARSSRRLGVVVILSAAILAAGCDRVVKRSPAIRQENAHQIRGKERTLQVEARMTGGRFILDRTDTGELYNLDMRWDAANMERRVDFFSGENARLVMAMEGSVPDDEAIHACLSLAGDVPIELNVETGAGDTRLDLTGLNVSRINIVHGVGRLRVAIDEPQESSCRWMEVTCGVGEMEIRGLANLMPERFNLKGGLGQATVKFDGDRPGRTNAELVVGIGNLDIAFPDDLGVRILDPGEPSGRLSVPKEHFERRSGAYVSSNYRQADRFLEISVKPGLGTACFEVRE
jgi:hypothetical protein